MEVNFKEWKVNSGLTDFDFARGFQTDYQTQINQLKIKLENRPQDEKLYWLISQLYHKKGNLEKTIINLQNAIRLKDKLKYRKFLAQTYQLQGNYKQALAEIKAALQLDYTEPSLHYLAGEIELQLGEISQARYFLEKAVEYEPENTTYLEKLFWIYSNLASRSDSYMLNRAQRIVKKLIKLKPKNEDYIIYLGDIYFDKGERIKAVKMYNKAIELAPNDTWPYIKLAQFYQKINNNDKAEELYRYVLCLNVSLENQQRLTDF